MPVKDSRSVRIEVAREVGRLLMLRAAAASLRQRIAEAPTTRVLLDFTGVEFMSRSFADEYLAARSASGKRVIEQGISPEVRKMLDLVASQIASSKSHSGAVRTPTSHPSALAL